MSKRKNGLSVKGSLPLKWHGGKHYLAEKIISRFPPHIHYCEPYFGGGAVLFAKPDEWIEGHSEVINDINDELMNFWSVLKHDRLRLQERLELTPFSSVAFNRACDNGSVTRLSRAVDLFVRYRQSRQGLGKDFATLTRNRVRRGMNEQVSAWLSAIEGLPEAHARLQRVVILNDDALKVIRQQDGENTFFYLDPPYLSETRTAKEVYDFEMDYYEHEELLCVLATMKGKFMLSGYHSGLYDEMAELHGWSCDEILIDNKASGKKKKDMETECLWYNY